MADNQPDCDNANYEGFYRAYELVRDALDGGVTFEWPGYISVLVTPRIEISWGLVNDTIGANVHVRNGDMWDETDQVLDTDVPRSEPSAQVMADAIIAAVRAFSID